MPERLESFAAGEYYHVFNRGALRQPLYHRSDLYHIFIDYAVRFANDYGVSIIALCLMPNHFHLIIRLDEGGDLSGFMCRLCHAFSMRSNRALDRKGTAFEGRFKAKRVTDDVYFRRLCMYVHANPVKGGLVEHPMQWQYSSYSSTVRTNGSSPYDVRPIIDEFGSQAAFETELIDYCQRHQSEKHQGLVRSLGEMGLL